jgi:F-type H+-transporting ATPase subunit b
MLIDWFTVAAQITNFLLLVWLLKRFLYKPILGAMDAREQRIAAQLRDAETHRCEAEAQSKRLRDAREEFERQKQALLSQAKAEAEATRQRLTEEARAEIQVQRLKWRETLREGEKALQAEITNSVQKEIFAIIRQVLRDLAGTNLEQQIVTAFVRRLKELDGDEKEQLESVVRTPNKPLTIRSAFDLPPAMRTEIESAVRQVLDAHLSVRFETVPEMLGGIELASEGRKISWSIAGYLSSLEQHVRRLVKQTPVAREQSE